MRSARPGDLLALLVRDLPDGADLVPRAVVEGRRRGRQAVRDFCVGLTLGALLALLGRVGV